MIGDKGIDPIDPVCRAADTVSRVLSAGGLFLAVILLLKIVGMHDVDLLNNSLPIRDAWLVAVALTVAHLYVTVILLGSIGNLESHGTHDDRLRAFQSISRSGGLFFRGLMPRTDIIANPSLTILHTTINVSVYRMRRDDATTWLALGGALLIAVATVPFHWTSWHDLLWIGVAAYLVAVNWWVGGIWAISLSKLSHRIVVPDRVRRRSNDGLADLRSLEACGDEFTSWMGYITLILFGIPLVVAFFCAALVHLVLIRIRDYLRSHWPFAQG